MVSAGGKVSNLVTAPMDAFGVATATFAGQNYGAGRIDRVRSGVRSVGVMLTVYALLALCINYFFGGSIALLFVDSGETEIIRLVARYLVTLGLFYISLGLIFVFRNTLQGVGFSKVAMLSGVFELIARALMGTFIVPRFGFDAVCFAHPFAWVMADMILIPLYITLMRRLDRRPLRTEG